ncbi:MAG: hypothetical protein JW908_03980 [Anaerolineales bacterium]|nr:hypothetical protein [Anaerolineales bacterium]
MITIDVTDELETKTENDKIPKRRLCDIIWWGFWKNGHNTSHPKAEELIFLGQITLQGEIHNGKWRV